MKKICIVNFNVYCLFDPKSSAQMGGAELDMYTLAKGLSTKCQVSVITGDWGQKKIEKIEGIKIYKAFSLERKILNYFKAPFILWWALKKVDAGIYIAASAGIEIGIISLFCQFNKKKFIYRTAHEIDCNKEYIRLNRWRGWLYKYGIEHAQLIVTSVRNHGRLINSFHPHRKGRICHINLGILPKSDRYKKNAKDYILWVGRCENWKKPEIFLGLAKSFPQHKFIMICPKQNHNEEYFYLIKQQAELLQNMTFIDFVLYKDIQFYFNNAKLFVNTSDFEGFTYTLIQSGLSCTPVVYLNVNPDEVITRYNIGFFAGGDKEKLKRDVLYLLCNENVWKQKSSAINQYTKKNHAIKKLIVEWIDFINRI